MRGIKDACMGCKLMLGDEYIFPFGTNTMGQPRHGTEKHGPGMVRPGKYRGPAVVPCLGR